MQLLRELRDRVSDARVIVATNRNLQKLVEDGKFRQDLFYRLNILTCQLPPRREHIEDLDLLADHFLDIFCRKCGKPLAAPAAAPAGTATSAGMACGKCGAGLPAGARFCARCGAPVGAGGPTPSYRIWVV